MLNNLKLCEDDFALQTEDFVRKCIELACLPSICKSNNVFHQFVSALRAGHTRMSVAKAVAHLAAPSLEYMNDPTYNSIIQPMDNHIVTDMLLNFAPNNDVAFLEFSAKKILGRNPEEGELLSIEFDLRRHTISRRGCIDWLTRYAKAAGRNVVYEDINPSLAHPNNFGFSSDAAGAKQYVAVNSTGFASWEHAPNIIAQNHTIQKARWEIQPGWLITGPKVSFEPGIWLLKLDFIQPDDATLVVDVVANSGLDVLFCQEFTGSVAASIKINIKESHFFLELRLLKPVQVPSLCWITPRKIALVKLD